MTKWDFFLECKNDSTYKNQSMYYTTLTEWGSSSFRFNIIMHMAGFMSSILLFVLYVPRVFFLFLFYCLLLCLIFFVSHFSSCVTFLLYFWCYINVPWISFHDDRYRFCSGIENNKNMLSIPEGSVLIGERHKNRSFQFNFSRGCIRYKHGAGKAS